MKTIGLALLGLCYAVLIIHVVRTLWGHFRPPHPQNDVADVTYMGKSARIEHEGRERSLIVMEESGARVWVKNKNIKRQL